MSHRRDAIGCWPKCIDYEWPWKLEADYCYWHAPLGCNDHDCWNHGCWGCEEKYDAYDMIVPCKREAKDETQKTTM